MRAQSLKDARKRRRLTCEQVGRLIGVDRSTISRLERGETHPMHHTAMKLEKALGCPLRFPSRQRAPAKDNRPMARAHAAVSKAIAEGLIVRPSSCSKCGGSVRIEGHHEDYSKPLDVVWLCGKCHRDLHKAHRAAERQARRAA